MLGINRKNLKLMFLTFSVCLAGLSLSDLTTTYARSEGGIEEILFERIVVADEKNKLETAKEDIQRVLKLNPRHVGANYYAGKFSYMAGNKKNAEKFLKRIASDKIYGEKAKALLVELDLSAKQEKEISAIKQLVAGGAFNQAKQRCEELFTKMPNSAEGLFQAALIECLLNNRDKAETYSLKYNNLRLNEQKSEDLNMMIDAWFMPENKEKEALEKLLAIRNFDLLIPPVIEKIKHIAINNGQVDKFEQFIEKETLRQGADVSALEGELIKFYIDSGKYDKAAAMLDKRPLDSLNDNLLYVEMLAKSGNEMKALENARYLLGANQSEMRCYKAWAMAWCACVAKTGELPGDTEFSRNKHDRFVDKVFSVLSPSKVAYDDPEMLMDLCFIAIQTRKDSYGKKYKRAVCEIDFVDKLSKSLNKLVDLLIRINEKNTALDILQSIWEGFQTNLDIPMKIVDITIDDQPDVAIGVLDFVINKWPDNHKAFLLWLDCMKGLGRSEEALVVAEERLKRTDLSEIESRQLFGKYELLKARIVNAAKSDNENENEDEAEKASVNADDSKENSSGDTLSGYKAPIKADNNSKKRIKK